MRGGKGVGKKGRDPSSEGGTEEKGNRRKRAWRSVGVGEEGSKPSNKVLSG